MTFRDLGLEPELLNSIDRLGFETPTPIQIQCFAPGSAGKNIVGISQTGTGKTLAFLLPILNRIYSEKIDTPTCIILAPTRELCVQISEELVRLTAAHPLRVATVYGGEGYNRQEKELAAMPHFIVATPGRLIDFMKQKKIPVETMKVLVLDEADRMFDMGFIRDIRYVMRAIPENSQIMLFTATMSYYVMRLITDFMEEPEHIKIDTDQVEVEKIKQSLYHLSIDEKMPYLVNLIRSIPDIKGIVFTNSRHRVQDIVRVLGKYGVHATGISSLLDQKKRIHLLKSFKLGKYNVLVATDVASRGLDIDDITHVFNYDLPQDAESYVHRIGRTARAGKEGTAISFCSEMDYECLPRIEILLEHKIPVDAIDPEMFIFPAPSPISVPEEERLNESDRRPRGDRLSDGNRRGGRDSRGGRGQGSDRRSGERPARPEAAVAGESGEQTGKKKRRRKKNNQGREATIEGVAGQARDGQRGPARQADSRPGDSRQGESRRGGRNDSRRDSGRGSQGRGRQDRDNRGRGDQRREQRRDTRREQREPVKKPSLLQRIIGLFKKKD